MGMYINSINGTRLNSGFIDKVKAIIEEGGKVIESPTEFKEGLVCVVNNGAFAAAAYAYSEDEMNVFLHPDGRQKQWLLWPEAKNNAG